MGAESATVFMSRPAPRMVIGFLCLLLGYCGMRAIQRQRWDSCLIHIGSALILAGWLWNRQPTANATPDHPANGSILLQQGETSDQLWQGKQLADCVGRLPFSICLNRFVVTYYDEQQPTCNRKGPVREYRAHVTINEHNKLPYEAVIRVNHPIRVQGYHIYQMSWGRLPQADGSTVIYTVLFCKHDPGLPLVYAGFGLLFVGVALFALKILRIKTPTTGAANA